MSSAASTQTLATTVTLYIATSVDGYVASSDGGVEWLESFEDSYEYGVAGGSYEAFFETVDALVMGSTTYEQVLGFGEWPYGDRPTYVTSGRDLSTPRDTIAVYDGDLAALVADEFEPRYGHVWLVGGAALAQDFLAQGLVDELRLSLVPVLLGDGIRLFDGDGTAASLHLVDETAYDDGIVEVRYAVRSD